MDSKINWKWWLGPFGAMLIYSFASASGRPHEFASTAALAGWMAIWWITEAVELYITALIPLALFPILGILPMKEVAPLFTKEIVFLFIGGFFIAFAMEKWKLHERIALKIILSIGRTPGQLLLGVMLASYVLSMWLMNTTTVTMLIPATLSIIYQIEKFTKRPSGTPYLLGLAYASSIGGMATLIGTAPNLIMAQNFNDSGDGEITFAGWFIKALPLSVMLFFLAFYIIRLRYRNLFKEVKIDLDECRRSYKELGPFSKEEKRLGSIVLMGILMWFTIKEIEIGSISIPSWTNWLPDGTYVKESTVGMLLALTLFMIPSAKKEEQILSWQEAKKLPLGIIFLFGGGFALAEAFKVNGVSEWLIGQLTAFENVPLFVLMILLSLMMTFLTEITSNTASTILVVPIILSFAHEIEVPSLQLLFVVTISASCAFMLPVATPPNTIVYASEKIKIKEMVRTGIWINVFGAVVISLYSYFVL